jgi:hypothetical protein
MRLILILFAFGFTGVYSQNTILTGHIIDKDSREGVSYSTVMFYKTGQGTLSDSLGNFRLQINKNNLVDSIYFSCVGYKDTVISIKDLKDNVELQPKVQKINEIVVFGAKSFEKYIGCQKKYLFNTIDFVYNTGTSIRLYFPYNNSFIQSVGFHIKKIDSKSVSLSIRIIKPDTTSKGLGEDLINERVLVKLVETGWIDVDLSKYKIKIPDIGFIVVIDVVGFEDKTKEHHISFDCTSSCNDYLWMSWIYNHDMPLDIGNRKYRPACRVKIKNNMP